MANCSRCLVSDHVPGVNLDTQRVCSLCRKHERTDRSSGEVLRQKREQDLEKAIESCRGTGAFDCLVGLSGGKDSCYLVHKLKVEYGLNILAYTVNINIPDVAWDNIRRTVKKLDIPHLVYTPPEALYTKMFRHLLQNQGKGGAVRTVCYICAPLTEGYAIQAAVEKDIPLILMGYSPGQPDPERMEYEFAPEMISSLDWTPAELKASGEFSEADLSLFWNPGRCPRASYPRFLAPFHAWEYNQEAVMKAVVELGLARSRKHANPIHSNCPYNWLFMYSDLKNLGYNSYAPEFAKLIREGKANRNYWRVVQPILNWMIRHRVLLGGKVTECLARLGLTPDDLRITRPAVSCRPLAETGDAQMFKPDGSEQEVIPCRT